MEVEQQGALAGTRVVGVLHKLVPNAAALCARTLLLAPCVGAPHRQHQQPTYFRVQLQDVSQTSCQGFSLAERFGSG